MDTWVEQFSASNSELKITRLTDYDGVQMGSYETEGKQEEEEQEYILDLEGEGNSEEDFESLLTAKPVGYQEPEWTPILSCDPGPANCALVYIEYRFIIEKKIIEMKVFPKRMKTVRIVDDMKSIDIPQMNRNVKSKLWASFPTKKLKGGVGLIENQYSSPNSPYWLGLNLQCLQTTVYNVLLETFQMAFVELINSSHYKSVLRIRTGNHTTNKQEAIKFAQNLLPFHIEDDHQADAFNQAYYWLLNSLKETLNVNDYKIVIIVDDSE